MTTRFYFNNLIACTSTLYSGLNLDTQWLLDDLNGSFNMKSWTTRYVVRNRYKQSWHNPK